MLRSSKHRPQHAPRSSGSERPQVVCVDAANRREAGGRIPRLSWLRAAAQQMRVVRFVSHGCQRLLVAAVHAGDEPRRARAAIASSMVAALTDEAGPATRGVHSPRWMWRKRNAG